MALAAVQKNSLRLAFLPSSSSPSNRKRCLVHDRGGLKRMSHLFTLHHVTRHPPHVLENEFEEAIGGLWFAGRNAFQCCGDRVVGRC